MKIKETVTKLAMGLFVFTTAYVCSDLNARVVQVVCSTEKDSKACPSDIKDGQYCLGKDKTTHYKACVWKDGKCGCDETKKVVLGTGDGTVVVTTSPIGVISLSDIFNNLISMF